MGAKAKIHREFSWWVTKPCFSEKPSWWVLRPCITVSPAGGCQSPALWGARLVDTWVLFHRDRSLSLTLQGTQLMGAWTPLHREPDWRRPKACFIRSPVGCCLDPASLGPAGPTGGGLRPALLGAQWVVTLALLHREPCCCVPLLGDQQVVAKALLHRDPGWSMPLQEVQ